MYLQQSLQNRPSVMDFDGGNSALVVGFSQGQSWGLKNTIFEGISEPQLLPWLKCDY